MNTADITDTHNDSQTVVSNLGDRDRIPNGSEIWIVIPVHIFAKQENAEASNHKCKKQLLHSHRVVIYRMNS